ncbi:MAG TPA: DUF885 domain-containing protein [Candidatus Eisenbacteria bacterium]
MPMSPDHARLTELAEAYYRRGWERFPTSGSSAGLAEFDHRLEAPDAGVMEDALADARDTLAKLEAIPAPAVGASIDEKLDRKEFEAQLRLAILHSGTIRNWRRNPADPVDQVVSSLFFLLVRRDVDSPETAESMIGRLSAVPAFLDAVRSRTDDPVALWVDVALESAEGGAPFLKELADGMKERHPSLAPKFDAAVARATPAMESYGKWLAGLKGKTLREDPSIGREALTEMIRWNHGLSDSVDEVKAYGRKQMAELKARQVEVARAIDPAATPAELMARENRRWAETKPDMLAEYNRITFALRDRLVADGILELPPGEACDVIATPSFLRPMIPTAAYSSPGPFDKRQRGLFYVTAPDPALDEADFIANVAQHFPLDPTCAHEAYPGHHVQLCWANQAPTLIRKLADHIIFMEGWTLYCEQLMVELGWYPSKVYELGYLNDQLWRACRIVIDASVQSGEMTIDEAKAMLQQEVGFTPQRAQAELNWYTQSPGTPMSYLLGKGKTLALREAWMSKNQGGTLKQFHKWMLTQGSVPQGWLMEAM